MGKNHKKNKFRFWHSINLYNNVKKLFFSIIPKRSKVYEFTHSILNVFLRQLKLFNIYYHEWIRRFDTPELENIQSIQNQINSMANKPIISVIMPVFNPPLELLDQAIHSVIDQVYPFWELCLADDASTDARIPSLIQAHIQTDNRIKAVFRKENGHISAASNSALELATNEFMALLDHDDILHPLALYYVATTINKHPDGVIIYSDEDKITRKGKRVEPYFKPEFDYELLLSQNMISHLGVYRTQIVREVGGFRIGLEGSQDYDLVLRVIDHCGSNQIYHIPRPLYHWRTIRESAARNLNSKPYAIDSAKRAHRDHFARKSIDAKVEFLPELAGYDVRYNLPDPQPSLSLIIPCRQLTERIFRQADEIIRNTNYQNYQIMIGLAEVNEFYLKSIPQKLQEKVKIHRFEGECVASFSQLVNVCVGSVSTDYICILDENLIGFSSGWLYELLGQASQPDIGAVGPKIINSTNNRVISNGIILTHEGKYHHLSRGEEKEMNGYFGWGKLTRGYTALTHNCLLFKRIDFDSVSGFCETLHLPVHCGIDFCLKLKKLGYRNILRPMVELYIQKLQINSFESDMSNELLVQDQEYLNRTWCTWFENDPSFSPNLDIIDEKFLINLNPIEKKISKI